MSVEPIIDQFTLILQSSSDNFDFDEWDTWVANDLINTFLIKSRISTLFTQFGPIINVDGGILKNYTEGYSFDNLPFYFRIAYHPLFIKMGISVYFSAYSWAEYQKLYEKQYGEPIQLHTFLKMVDSNDYSLRLSRIDVGVDFKNENIDIAQIHRSLKAGRTEVRYRHE